MARSELVTNGNIHSMPTNDAFRDGWARIEENNELIAQADAQLETDGLVDTSLLSTMLEAGLDISDYT